MKIFLSKLSMINFKGQKNLEIDFSDNTTIYGVNGSGKSTVFSAFNWLLFGKDEFDRKDYGIKTFDKNNIIIPKIDHEVTGLLLLDGVETKLTRILKEKWTKKRGEDTAEFVGNETVYFINDVPKSQAEYQAFISSIIPESTFKLLTSPAYFNSLKWNERREMLISIAGVPTDEEIAGSDLVSLLDLMQREKKTIEDLKKEYAAKKKKLKDALDQIPTRIDENHRGTPEAKDFTKIEADLKQAKHNLSLIEAEIMDASKGVQEAVRLRSEKLLEKSNIETRMQRLEFDAKSQFANAGNSKDQDIRTKQQRVSFLTQELANFDYDLKTNNGRLQTQQEQRDSLRNQWTKRDAETLNYEGSFSCPTCGQSLPDDLIAHQETDAKTAFNKKKILDLQEIEKYGANTSIEINRLQSYIEGINVKIKTAKDEIEKLNSEIAVIQNTPVQTKTVETILAENAEYSDLKAKHEAIVIPEIVQAADTTNLQINKVELSEEISRLTRDLSIREQITELTKRKSEIETEGRSLSQQIADLEKIEFQIETFTKRKMNDVENRVNSLFKTVRFKMFQKLINGGEEPTCECLLNGVPFDIANQALQVNSGIEIINVFSAIHNCYAPVFVDKSESVLKLSETQSQIIRLVVSEMFKVKESGKIVSKLNGYDAHEIEEYAGLLVEA